MIPTEVAAFLAKVATIDNRRLTPQTIDSWAEILDPRITMVDAWAAAKDHFATRAGDYLMPGHINDGVRQMRRARLAVMRTPEPPAELDGDVRAELTWVRAYRDAVATGLEDPDGHADEISGVVRVAVIEAARPVGALVEQTAQTTRIPRKAS